MSDAQVRGEPEIAMIRDTRGPAVVMEGNLTSGFHCYGPFASIYEAVQWAKTRDVICSVILLRSPK